jgi:hypothetical protein
MNTVRTVQLVRAYTVNCTCCKLVKRPIKNSVLCHYSWGIKIFENTPGIWRGWGGVNQTVGRIRPAGRQLAIVSLENVGCPTSDGYRPPQPVTGRALLCFLPKYPRSQFPPPHNLLARISSAVKSYATALRFLSFSSSYCQQSVVALRRKGPLEVVPHPLTPCDPRSA